MKVSLKAKAILLIVVIAGLLSGVSIFSYSNAAREFAIEQYSSRTVDLSSTVATVLDGERVHELKDAVFEIYDSLDEKLTSEDIDSPEYDEYLANFESIEQTENFQQLQTQLRDIQDVNNVDCVYLVYPDMEIKTIVYLVDASYEDNCPPGTSDPLSEQDMIDLEDPEEGLRPDITNTYYGWLVASGVPIYDQGEIIAFACTDFSMDEVMKEQQRFLFTVTITILCLTALCIFGGIILVDNLIVKPIKLLTKTSEDYYRNSDNTEHYRFEKLDIHTGDEVEQLADAMAQMEEDINDHIANLLAANEYAGEMNRIAALGRNESLEPWQRIGAAIDYALYDDAQDSGMTSVFRRADVAMYEHKKAIKASC